MVGNHDAKGEAEIISHLLGIKVLDEYSFTSGDKKVLVLHGHVFDDFIDNHPIITKIGDYIYNFLQKIDKTHTIARLAKRNSKQYLNCLEEVRKKAINLAIRRGCQIICCGHTHHEMDVTEDGVQYLNSGCWTELPCHYLTINNGVAQLCEYKPEITDLSHDQKTE